MIAGITVGACCVGAAHASAQQDFSGPPREMKGTLMKNYVNLLLYTNSKIMEDHQSVKKCCQHFVWIYFCFTIFILCVVLGNWETVVDKDPHNCNGKDKSNNTKWNL